MGEGNKALNQVFYRGVSRKEQHQVSRILHGLLDYLVKVREYVVQSVLLQQVIASASPRRRQKYRIEVLLHPWETQINSDVLVSVFLIITRLVITFKPQKVFAQDLKIISFVQIVHVGGVMACVVYLGGVHVDADAIATLLCKLNQITTNASKGVKDVDASAKV